MPYTDSLAHFYQLSVPVGMPDTGVVGGNPGTGANIASNPVGIHGKSTCAEFNGNNSNYNLGDVAELNAVEAFTIAFWMRQDVLNADDMIFSKNVGVVAERLTIQTISNNHFYFEPQGSANRGHFVYGAVVDAGRWHHVTMVFNGAGVGNAGRLQVYIDAVPVTLILDGTIPALTADMSGDDARIGGTVNAFDGLLDSFAIFSRPLTQLQVADHMLATRQGRL